MLTFLLIGIAAFGGGVYLGRRARKKKLEEQRRIQKEESKKFPPEKPKASYSTQLHYSRYDDERQEEPKEKDAGSNTVSNVGSIAAGTILGNAVSHSLFDDTTSSFHSSNRDDDNNKSSDWDWGSSSDDSSWSSSDDSGGSFDGGGSDSSW